MIRIHRVLSVAFACLLLLGAAPSVASAHFASTGLGPFYDGVTTLFLTPEDLLPAIALALFAGLRGPRFGRVVLFVLPAACLVGGLVGTLLHSQLTLPAVTAAVTVLIGALVAGNVSFSLPSIAGLAVFLGLLDGSLSGGEMSKLESGDLAIAGLACALFIIVALLAGQVALLRATWARVAVRVGGSWIVASGLFMLGWALRPA